MSKKTVVIAEKPSVGRDIARVLRCNKKINGALEGDSYIVTWALGHLVTLADPEGYDDKYKEWSLSDLPMLPDILQLEVIKQSAKQYQAVKTQLKREDVGQIIIATDAGREGELVARLILNKTGVRKPIKRLWISSVTDKAIKEGFAHLHDGREYDNLYDAALSRAEADWLVGINATRALTCKYNAQLSCGRVQTPTLAMIAKREEEIRAFVPKSYYGLKARVALPLAQGSKSLTFLWIDKATKSSRSFQKQRMEQLLKSTKASNGVIKAVTISEKRKQSPLFYDLTELQRDANLRYGFSAKETLNIMQRLYENHKVLTYPRTDSRYLTTDIVDTLKERLKACSVGPYRQVGNGLVSQKFSPKVFYVNNQKVSDHHAIIPTEQYVNLSNMTNEERKIYDLVVKRFFSALSPDYEYSQVMIEADFGGETFTTKTNVIQKLGWKAVYGQEESVDEEEEVVSDKEDVVLIKQMKKGDTLQVQDVTLTEGKTNPPAPFNEATLLTAMEHPQNYLENKDKQTIQTLDETGGLGTVATRADIIEKLFSSFLIEKRGKDLFITSKGKQLLELVPEDLKKPELTASWETKLSRIAKGNLKRDSFIIEIKDYANTIIKEIKEGEKNFRHDNLTNQKCPNCGKRLLLVKGKNATLHVCQDRECGYRETVSRSSNARCPKCHKRMELYGKENKVFQCSCGYREKLDSFTERRKKEGSGVSKKDVARYLNQQKKEDVPLNNPFADAFSKLNLK